MTLENTMQLQVPVNVAPSVLLRQIADHIDLPAPQTERIPRLGELWPGRGGRFVGTIRDEGGDHVRAVIVADADEAQFKGEWGNYGTKIDGANSASDGLANTKAMAAAGSEIAKKALALTLDGHADFYIPSRREQSLCEMHARDLFKPEWYWSSTQSSAHYAFIQYFDDGNQDLAGKVNDYLVRAVRSFVLQ